MTAELQEALRTAILSSPSLFPLELTPNGDAVHFLSMSEDDYRNASFLDRRMLVAESDSPNRNRIGTVPWAMLEPWLDSLPMACDFIFHVSHAGSTLLSRLLGLHPRNFAIREPLILRSLAQGNYPDRLRRFIALWSRTFRADQRAMIKATSFVSEIGTDLMEQVPEARTLLMTVPPETFIASVLDGSMSDIESQAQSRLLRLHQHGIATSHSIDHLSPGELAAMSWLAEMNSLQRLSGRYPSRSMWIDFDRFLEDPVPSLRNVLQFLDLDADPNKLLAHPIMQRYAKRTEISYDSNFRRRLIDAARFKHEGEIAKGLTWLDSFR